MRPVSFSAINRIVRDRHRIVRVTLAGRECHVKRTVPVESTMRFVVIMRKGYMERRSQTGETKRQRIERVIRTGPVVVFLPVRRVEIYVMRL